MTFELTIPRPTGETLSVALPIGQTLFILGANGTGKSSLMQRLYSAHSGNAHRISAHRQTWFSSNSMTLSANSKRETLSAIQNRDIYAESRWKDDYSAARASISIYDLIDAENTRARSIAHAVDAHDISLAETLAKKDAPIKVINELLRLSHLPLGISVQQNQEVVASKSGGTPYSIAELSDGERNALLIAADVLTVREGTLLLIDEPERHLHRSIISPLLTQLFAKRPDCAFIVSTHEVMLPLDNRRAVTMLVRGCEYLNAAPVSWDVDLIPPDSDIEEDLRKDILGSRRKVLFIEGEEQSLDKPLYSIIFPGVSVIAKLSCRDVESAVSGIRGAQSFHWLYAFGIIDNDRRTPEDIDRLKAKGVYALSVYAVESIYYHPEVQRQVAQRYAQVTGEDAQTLVDAAKSAAIKEVMPHVERLSHRAVEKTLRNEFEKLRPKQSDIVSGNPINVTIDVATVVAAESARLQDALRNGDTNFIISQYPIRDTGALKKIAERLGFQSRSQYENAVRKMLMDNHAVLSFVRSLFGTLSTDINM